LVSPFFFKLQRLETLEPTSNWLHKSNFDIISQVRVSVFFFIFFISKFWQNIKINKQMKCLKKSEKSYNNVEQMKIIHVFTMPNFVIFKVNNQENIN